MAESDWDAVTVLRKKAPTKGQLSSNKAVAAAQRQGLAIDTTKKYAGGQNKQHAGGKNTLTLDNETEELSHKHLGLSQARAIQQGRQDKGMTQKELATRINEKPQVINDYEAGRAIPNQQIMNKLERVLGVKLRGKDTGAPLGKPKKK